MASESGARGDFFRRYSPPKEWEIKSLGDLAEIVGGGTPSRGESRYWADGNIPWVTPSDITANAGKYLAQTEDQITRAGLLGSAAKLLPIGTVLYTSRATLGAKAIAARPIATNQGFASSIARKGVVDNEYLYYLLDLLLPAVTRLGSGTTFLEVSKRDLKKVVCALPNIEEQARIASVLAAVDVVIERTTNALTQALNVKRSLTQALFEGGTCGKPTKKTRVGIVPDSWEVVEVDRVCLAFEYGLSVPMQTDGMLPILRMGNIQNGDVRFRDLKYVTLDEKTTRPYLAQRGDVFFNRVNSQEHVGKVGVYRLDDPSVFASYLIRVVPNPELVDGYFLGQLLNA